MPFLAKQKQKENLVRKILQIQARYRVVKSDTFSARGGQGLHIFPVFINPNYMGGGILTRNYLYIVDSNKLVIFFLSSKNK